MRFLSSLVVWLTAAFVLPACIDDSGESVAKAEHTVKSDLITMDVYKTPSCGCCGKWVEHIERSGFQAKISNLESLAAVKDQLNIPENARSCHTAVAKDGYVFEGHVPAKYMAQFLDNPPAQAKGLIVPAMPLGSPGMEYQNQFNPYAIWLLKHDGEMLVYAEIKSYDQQF